MGTDQSESGLSASQSESGLSASQSDHSRIGPTDQNSPAPPSCTGYPTLTNSLQDDPDLTKFEDDPDPGFIPDEASWQSINKVIGDTPKPDTSSCLSPMASISLCKHGHFLCQSVHHSGTLTILLNKSQLVRRKQNEKIDKEEGLSGDNPDQHLKNMIDSALMPQRDPAFRCPTCRICSNCAPIESLTRKQKLVILLKRESPTITSNTRIVNGPTKPGFLKIITKLPLTADGGQSNFHAVLREFDRKMLKLDSSSKQSLQSELDKAIAANFVSKVSDLPEQLQAEIKKDSRFVSTVAAFKESGSTPARICTNFSAGKLSENDVALTGKTSINLEKTARLFKTHSHVATLDVKKFFHQICLSDQDVKRHLFCWRQDLDPKNPPEIFCYTRLCFGHTSASLISEESVKKIANFGELVCTHCTGNYSALSPTNSSDAECPGISHQLAILCSKMNVDDLILATSSEKNLTLLINYAIALFGLFGFSFKEANISHLGRRDTATSSDPDPPSCTGLTGKSSGSSDPDPPSCTGLTGKSLGSSDPDPPSCTGLTAEPSPEQSQDDLVGVLGYRWHPKKDFIKLKSPTISNGKKSRGKLVASKLAPKKK